MKYLLVFLLWGSVVQASNDFRCNAGLIASGTPSREIVEICQQESLTFDHEHLSWWIEENEKYCRVMAPHSSTMTYESCMTKKLDFAESVFTCSQDLGKYEESTQIDREQNSRLLQEHGESEAPAQLATIFKALTQAADKNYKYQGPRRQWQLTVYDAPYNNAHAGTNGQIIISSGFWLGEVEFTASEIAAILAHEVSHEIYNHSLEMNCLAHEWIAGNQKGTLKDAVQTYRDEFTTGMPRGQAFSKKSQRFEYEADANAVKLLKLVGIDPMSMANALFKLKPKNSGGFSTGSHPEHDDRIKAVQDLILRGI